MSDIKTGAGDAKATFKQVKKHFSPALAMAGKFMGQGAVETSADGCRVTLSDGRQALDFGSYAVALLGHRNTAVVEAVRDQLDRMPTSTRSVLNPVPAQAAETVVDYLGGVLPKVYFGGGGADAVEASVKLARVATGRSTVIAVEGGYHGKTLGALALTHHERFRSNLGPVLAGAVHVDPTRPDAVARVLAETDAAALIFEPVQGENGVTELDPEILARWCADAKAAGAFVIADEIQVGLRRCGERSLALAAGLPVDAVLLGKASAAVSSRSPRWCAPRSCTPRWPPISSCTPRPSPDTRCARRRSPPRWRRSRSTPRTGRASAPRWRPDWRRSPPTTRSPSPPCGAGACCGASTSCPRSSSARCRRAWPSAA